MAAAPARSASLIDQLQEQWGLADVKPEFRADGELLISFLDDDGYLRTPFETIIDRTPNDRAKPTVEQLERALQAVQLFLELVGTAARKTAASACCCRSVRLKTTSMNFPRACATMTLRMRSNDAAVHDRAEHDQASLEKRPRDLLRVAAC